MQKKKNVKCVTCKQILKLSTQQHLRKIQFLKYMYFNYEFKDSQFILIYDTLWIITSLVSVNQNVWKQTTLSSLEEKYQWKYADGGIWILSWIKGASALIYVKLGHKTSHY